MPNLRNARKALKQAHKRTLKNIKVKEAYKKALKEAAKVLGSGGELGDKIKLVQKKLDKAAQKGVIKRNTAARKLSRLMKKAHPSKK
ncbi:MAG: 30S ribosomal protein S20 [Candidatus Magasanikbacteria bacterium]|nr:30S ribosomal protein S20 [Candidatus Magasanikbacteria bacterium]